MVEYKIYISEMNVIRKIKSYLHLQKNIVESVKVITESQMVSSVDSLYYKKRYDELTENALKSSVSGVSDTKYGECPIIVSLTTHAKRIYDVHVAIESIMQGSLKPNKIVLWISDDYKNKSLPLVLKKQMQRGLEIEYCKDVRSYTKLIPSMNKYPEAAIVTIDDDIIYPYDMLESLVGAYVENPECICANWIHQIPANLNDEYKSLLDWPVLHDVDDLSLLYFYEGFGGVLYPPHSLDPEVFNENVFLDICKYADDVWFNAMSLKAGTKVKYAWRRYGLIPLVGNKSVQVVALRNVNSNGDILNDKQIKAVYGKYGLFELLKNVE